MSKLRHILVLKKVYNPRTKLEGEKNTATLWFQRSVTQDMTPNFLQNFFPLLKRQLKQGRKILDEGKHHMSCSFSFQHMQSTIRWFERRTSRLSNYRSLVTKINVAVYKTRNYFWKLSCFIQELKLCPFLSPPAAWGQTAGVPSQGGPLLCRKSLLRLGCHWCSLQLFHLHPPVLSVLLGEAAVGSGPECWEAGMEGYVGEMEVGWDRARKRAGPVQGPGWQMTPACRLNVAVLCLLLSGCRPKSRSRLHCGLQSAQPGCNVWHQCGQTSRVLLNDWLSFYSSSFKMPAGQKLSRCTQHLCRQSPKRESGPGNMGCTQFQQVKGIFWKAAQLVPLSEGRNNALVWRDHTQKIKSQHLALYYSAESFGYLPDSLWNPVTPALIFLCHTQTNSNPGCCCLATRLRNTWAAVLANCSNV